MFPHVFGGRENTFCNKRDKQFGTENLEEWWECQDHAVSTVDLMFLENVVSPIL